MRTFKARYIGRCYVCKDVINIGELITWDRTQNKRGSVHGRCQKEKVYPEAWHGNKVLEKIVTPDVADIQGDEFGGEVEGVGDHEVKRPDPVPPIKADNLTELIAGAVSKVLGDRLKTNLTEELEAQVADAVERINELADKLERQTPQITHVKVTRPNGTTVDAGLQHRLFPTFLRLIGYKTNLYLWGGPGSGKSFAPLIAAKLLDKPFGLISMSPTTPDSKLFGYMDANGNYVSTLFRRVWEGGGFFCIDELDNASAQILVTLNAALSTGHCAFPDGLVEKHEDFVLVATGNTSGRGAHPAFPDRRPFDQSTASRLFYLEWQIDESFEHALSAQIDPTQAARWVPWVQKVRQFCEGAGIRLAVDPRSSFTLTTMGQDSELTCESLIDGTIFRGIHEETKTKILASCPLPA